MNHNSAALIANSPGRRSRIRTLAAFAVAANLTSTSLAAQTLQQSAVSQISSSQVVTPAVNVRNVRFQRTLLGVGGELAGVFAGGTLGYALAGDCNSQREFCEWHGFVELLIGSVIGGVAGSAVGAAIPHGFGACSRGRRVKRAAVGSVVGAAIAFATVAVELETLALPVLVLAPPITAAYALKRC